MAEPVVADSLSLSLTTPTSRTQLMNRVAMWSRIFKGSKKFWVTDRECKRLYVFYFVLYHDNKTSLSPFFLLLPLWNDTKKQNSPSVELLRDKNYFLCVLKKYLKKINIFICKQNYKTFWGCGFWWNWQYSLHVQVWGCGIPQRGLTDNIFVCQ